MTSILSAFGMLLQFAGLALLPFAVLANLTSSDSYVFGVSNMLISMVAGVTIFYIGWFMRGFAEHSADDDDEDGEEKPSRKANKKKGK